MKPKYHAILYALITLVFFYLGFAQDSLYLWFAIAMALVSLYWVRKVKKK